MQDLEKAKRDYYYKVSNWLEDNQSFTLPGVSIISLFIALILVVVTSYFAFNQVALNERIHTLTEENQTLEFQQQSGQLSSSSVSNKIEQELTSAKKVIKSLEKSERKLENQISKLKQLVTKHTDRISQQALSIQTKDQSLELSEYKNSQSKAQLSRADADYQRLSSDYIKLNTELTQKIDNQQAYKTKLLIQSLSPIWFEKSKYFNNKATLALYINKNDELYNFMKEQVQYVYYKISGVKTDTGGYVFKPLDIEDTERGLYFIVYNKNSDDWVGKEKQAFIKLKSHEEEYVINFK